MRSLSKLFGSALAVLCTVQALANAQGDSWRYYRPGNTGVQGDTNEALWIGPDGDPYIAGYDAAFEEGGFAKFVQSENRWINFSNVDYPQIGHPDLTGTTRVSQIVPDANGKLWMSTWRGALSFDPSVGAPSLVNFGAANPTMKNGGSRDLDVAPDGTVWFALNGWGGTMGGVMRYTPSSGTWKYWTGGSPPVGGNNWPALVWMVASISIETKAGGGYVVWCDSENSSAIVTFDSTTQLWTHSEFSYTPGSILELPGKDCVDDVGNVWAQRFSHFNGSTAVFNLDYRKPDGTWVTPPQVALPAITPAIGAFRAFGNGQALLADTANRVRRFDGTAWQDYGTWAAGGWPYDAAMDAAGNVWVSGSGGAAKRNATTGAWQRYRVTNTSQYDSFANDLSLGANGDVYACANAGPGAGGMERFDGTSWTGFNNVQYGLGVAWPFPTDNSNAVYVRPSNGHVVVNPMFNGTHEWDGATWQSLGGGSTAIGYTEDSLGRLWKLGEYFDLAWRNGSTWTQVGITAWGQKIQTDPDRPGTIWATTGHEIKRTDGVYSFSKGIADFPQMTTQSDTFSGLAADHNGIAWVGGTIQFGAGGTGGALIRLDANTGNYTMWRYDQGWPLPGFYVTPLTVTHDGRVWMAYDTDFLTAQRGLCWFDGTNVGVYPAPPGGEPQWGGLPHAQIADCEVKELQNGYELWMSCKSRGVAVLTIHESAPGTIVCSGDGSGAPCPCGNESASGSQSGCKNSTNLGATLRSSGTASIGADDLVLTSANLPANKSALVFYGANGTGGTPFSSGLLCVASPLKRLAVKNSGAGGTCAHGPGLGTYAATHFAPAYHFGAGSSWTFQTWFRDPNGACVGKDTNTSNALAVQFLP
ncbi:MAG: hypothetical protein IT459_15655 [Planctomycetes bacterium]|nr:hypothetical protein [Planctomycetota bacterium]